MSKNRLQLDFSIEMAADRKKFLDDYLGSEQFLAKPLTSEELETCAKYLLYGKDSDGESCISRGEVQVDTKNKTWNNDHKTASLEFLMDKDEGPGFNEDMILKPYQAHYKNIREVFSREDALRKAPIDLKKIFIDLFKQIDETELLINLYDLQVGKREKAPRKELIEKFTEEEIERLSEKAKELTQYQYLKKKHNLVELRREQYTLRDSFDTKVTRDTANRGAPIEEDPIFTFECDATVFPLGLKDNEKSQELIFKSIEELIPSNFKEKDLKIISNSYWNRKENTTKLFFDFREMEHVYQLLLQYVELKNSVYWDDMSSTTKFLFDTLEYYIDLAEISEIQKEILNLKIKKVKNSDIANIINKKYDKSYTVNYISTIFRQKIIKQINNAALYHQEIIESIFFPENFKKCTRCGEILLICDKNFVKKNRAKDGYTNRCKKCDKLERISKKENANG